MVEVSTLATVPYFVNDRERKSRRNNGNSSCYSNNNNNNNSGSGRVEHGSPKTITFFAIYFAFLRDRRPTDNGRPAPALVCATL